MKRSDIIMNILITVSVRWHRCWVYPEIPSKNIGKDKVSHGNASPEAAEKTMSLLMRSGNLSSAALKLTIPHPKSSSIQHAGYTRDLYPKLALKAAKPL